MKTKPNEKCPCGSGKKYKKCCWLQAEAKSRDLRTGKILWEMAEVSERLATQELTDVLNPLAPMVRDCYQCAAIVVTLPGKLADEFQLGLAKGSLKRALTDLRAAWILLLVGYTSQAATVVASLFEHALRVSCYVGDAGYAKERALDRIEGDTEEGAWDLCKRYARQLLSRTRDGTDQDALDFAVEIYQPYKWLCRIKHPTFDSVEHDAGDGDGILVMAVSDTRSKNLPVKVAALCIAVARVLSATVRYGEAIGKHEATAVWNEYDTKCASVLAGLKECSRQFPVELPFGIVDPKFLSKLKSAKSRMNRERLEAAKVRIDQTA